MNSMWKIKQSHRNQPRNRTTWSAKHGKGVGIPHREHTCRLSQSVRVACNTKGGCIFKRNNVDDASFSFCCVIFLLSFLHISNMLITPLHGNSSGNVTGKLLCVCVCVRSFTLLILRAIIRKRHSVLLSFPMGWEIEYYWNIWLPLSLHSHMTESNKLNPHFIPFPPCFYVIVKFLSKLHSP